MPFLEAHLAELAALFGSLTAIWAFLKQLDSSYRTHLKDDFATKDDFRRLEDKLDHVLYQPVTRRKRKVSR